MAGNRPAWQIRQADVGDAAALSVLAEKTFRDAFGAMNSPSDIDEYCVRSFNVAAQERELSESETTTFVADLNGELIGYAQLQDCEPLPCVGDPSALYLKRIYVDERWHGNGVAQDLLRRVAQTARKHGGRTLWLTVWERNARGIRFYERLHMQAVGEAEFLLGSERQRDAVMAVQLSELLDVLSTPTETTKVKRT